MLKHCVAFVTIALALVSIPARAAEEPDHVIHEELRGLMRTAQQAISAGQFDDALPVLAENPRLTPITQEFLDSNAAYSAYFNKYFGAGKKLRSVKIAWEADVLTELSADKTWGLAYGKGVEDYTLNDGRTYPIPVRWTSVVVKQADSKWKIRSMHIGANFLDNPVLSEFEQAVKKYSISGVVLGLALGVAVGFFLGRRRKSAA